MRLLGDTEAVSRGRNQRRLYKLTPEQVSAALLVGTAHIVPTGDGMYIAVVLAPKPGWQKMGQLERE